MLSTTVGNSVVAMVPDLCRHLTYISREHGIQCMPCSTRILSEILPENHTMEKLDFLKTYFFCSHLQCMDKIKYCNSGNKSTTDKNNTLKSIFFLKTTEIISINP